MRCKVLQPRKPAWLVDAQDYRKEKMGAEKGTGALRGVALSAKGTSRQTGVCARVGDAVSGRGKGQRAGVSMRPGSIAVARVIVTVFRDTGQLVVRRWWSTWDVCIEVSSLEA